jgi:uncharacterized protein
VALVFPRDRNHESASSFYSGLRRDGVTMVTTDLVLSETLTLLQRRGLGEKSMRIFSDEMDAAREHGSLKLLFMDERSFRLSRDWFLKYEKLGVSFTDCNLALVARDIEADGVFAYDEHFRTLGLLAFPEGAP